MDDPEDTEKDTPPNDEGDNESSEDSKKKAPPPTQVEQQREELAVAEAEADAEVNDVVEDAAAEVTEAATDAAAEVDEAVEDAAEAAVARSEHLTEDDIPRIVDHLYERMRADGHLPGASVEEEPVVDEGETVPEDLHEGEPEKDTPPKKDHWFYR